MRRHNRKRDKTYMAFIASLACLVCSLPGKGPQQYRTEVAHVGDRGLMQKCSDRETLPLCTMHHTLAPESQHRAGKKFWWLWGIDRDAEIARLNALYEQEKAA